MITIASPAHEHTCINPRCLFTQRPLCTVGELTLSNNIAWFEHFVTMSYFEPKPDDVQELSRSCTYNQNSKSLLIICYFAHRYVRYPAMIKISFTVELLLLFYTFLGNNLSLISNSALRQ